MSRYPNLFSPISLGTLELPNRIVMAPMGTGYADEEHRVTDRLIAYHTARAQGGVGLNIVEHTAVHPRGLAGPRMLGILDDDAICGLRRLTEAVHAAGGRIALQLQHAGRQADCDVSGGPCLAPSPIPAGRDRRVPAEMAVKDIREAVRAFGEGARRAREAGFDGVEVHLAHGYLGCSFLSPFLNQRTDAYGGDTTRRTRFAAEVMEAIRSRCPGGFPVWCRVSADEFVQGGQTLAEMQRIAPLLQRQGYCAIHVSACIGETACYASAPHLLPEGHLLHLAEGVARTVDVPVIGVGNIRRPAFAESALANGRCDVVALGRALLADPEWPRKAHEGREREIIPCIYCNLACSDRRHSREGMCECVTNPATGREADWPDRPAGPVPRSARRVLVVGGGPAGATAAAAAARRGHHVTLWEARAGLGGRLVTLACADRSGVYEDLINSLATALDLAGVEVSWQQEADLFNIAAASPDVVVLATGARPLAADEALAEGASGETVSAEDLLQNPDMRLDHLVAVLGGDETGCAAALEAARRGRRVMLFERAEEIGPGMVAALRHFIARQLDEQRVQVLTESEVVSVADGRVTAVVRGRRQEFPQASVVVALGRRSETQLCRSAERLRMPVHIIGDATGPRTLHEVIREGAELGREL